MNTIHFNKQSLNSIAFLLEIVAMFVDGLLGGVFQCLGKTISNSNRSIFRILFSAFFQFLIITSVSRLVLEFMGMDISFLLEMCFYCLENHKTSLLFFISLLFIPVFYRIIIFGTMQAMISIVAKTHTECSISHILMKIKLYKSLITKSVVFGTSIEISIIKQ